MSKKQLKENMKLIISTTHLMLLSVLLSGCAAPITNYSIKPDTPFAYLRSGLVGAHERHNSITVILTEGECGSIARKKLFSVKSSISTPDDFIKVPANQPIKLFYDGVIFGGRKCQIPLIVVLEENKKYSLLGGEGFSDKNSLLFANRICTFSVNNLTDNSPPLSKKTNGECF